MFILKRNSNCFTKRLYHFTCPLATYEGSSFSNSLSTLGIFARWSLRSTALEPSKLFPILRVSPLLCHLPALLFSDLLQLRPSLHSGSNSNFTSLNKPFWKTISKIISLLLSFCLPTLVYLSLRPVLISSVNVLPRIKLACGKMINIFWVNELVKNWIWREI